MPGTWERSEDGLKPRNEDGLKPRPLQYSLSSPKQVELEARICLAHVRRCTCFSFLELLFPKSLFKNFI